MKMKHQIKPNKLFMNGWGGKMSIENKLIRYQKDLEETQSKIDQEKGALSSDLSSLQELLQIGKGKKTTEKKLIDLAEKKINALKAQKDVLETELENLMEEIEEDLA